VRGLIKGDLSKNGKYDTAASVAWELIVTSYHDIAKKSTT